MFKTCFSFYFVRKPYFNLWIPSHFVLWGILLKFFYLVILYLDIKFLRFYFILFYSIPFYSVFACHQEMIDKRRKHVVALWVKYCLVVWVVIYRTEVLLFSDAGISSRHVRISSPFCIGLTAFIGESLFYVLCPVLYTFR